MVLELEAFRDEGFQPTGTTVDVEEPITLSAVEMVVVLGCHGCKLVAIIAARARDVRNFTVILEPANHPVDGSYTQGADLLRGCRVDFFDREGSTGLLDRFPNRDQLPCSSLSTHPFCFPESHP